MNPNLELGVHELDQPFCVPGDPGVHPNMANSCTALPPADHTCQVPGATVVCGMGAAAVPFTGVLRAIHIASAEHVVCDLGGLGTVLGMFQAVLSHHPGHFDSHELQGCGPAVQQLAPATDP